jgi:hypothetical protein
MCWDRTAADTAVVPTSIGIVCPRLVLLARLLLLLVVVLLELLVRLFTPPTDGRLCASTVTIRAATDAANRLHATSSSPSSSSSSRVLPWAVDVARALLLDAAV